MLGKIGEKKLSRREILLCVGKLSAGAAGIAVVSTGLDMLSKAEAQGTVKYPWGYKRLDPEKVAEIAYENWYKGLCSYAGASSIIVPLQGEVGEPYTSLPLEAFTFGHGGVVGWGTICGVLIGVGIATSFAAGKQGEEIINEVINWFANTELPVYTPKSPKVIIKNKSRSDSPLCHISVSRWMKKEGVGLFSPERKERCARLAADVARQTVKLLNDWADGKFKAVHPLPPKVHNIVTQHNCADCHGEKIPKAPK